MHTGNSNDRPSITKLLMTALVLAVLSINPAFASSPAPAQAADWLPEPYTNDLRNGRWGQSTVQNPPVASLEDNAITRKLSWNLDSATNVRIKLGSSIGIQLTYALAP